MLCLMLADGCTLQLPFDQGRAINLEVQADQVRGGFRLAFIVPSLAVGEDISISINDRVHQVVFVKPRTGAKLRLGFELPDDCLIQYPDREHGPRKGATA